MVSPNFFFSIGLLNYLKRGKSFAKKKYFHAYYCMHIDCQWLL